LGVVSVNNFICTKFRGLGSIRQKVTNFICILHLDVSLGHQYAGSPTQTGNHLFVPLGNGRIKSLSLPARPWHHLGGEVCFETLRAKIKTVQPGIYWAASTSHIQKLITAHIPPLILPVHGSLP